MNGPFVVAQAGSSTANSASNPVQIIKITKPQAGHTEIFHASFSGVVKIDFTAIANERITFFHDNKNQSLHIIFADGSQAIIEPFFDSMGVLSNLLLEMGPNQVLDGAQFAAQFPITTDQTVLPAAGEGNPASGGDFQPAFVDPLGLPEPLPLLPPEELPPIKFTDTTPAALFATTEAIQGAPATVVGSLFAVVEEEQLNHEQVIPQEPTDAGIGNEDTNDLPANNFDTDTSDTIPGDLNITHTINGTLAGLVTGGSVTFGANSAADGMTVHDNNGNDVTSIGETVQFVFVDATTIEGRTLGEGGRLIFTLYVNADGSYTFTLNDQIDHPVHSNDDGTNPPGIFEETLNLDLSSAIVGHGASPDPLLFPTNTFDVGVIDDTPTLGCVNDGQGGDQGGDQQTQFAGDRHPGEGGNSLINGLGGSAGFGEQFALAVGDDNSSGFVDVTSIFPGGMNFFGTTYNGFYINNNGNITFGSSLSEYTPFALTGQTGLPIIAPFFADVDTRNPIGTVSPGGTSTGSDRVHLDFDATNGVITITWDDVGYYGAHDNLANAFQLIIYNTGGQNFAFEFRYENVDWTTGDASGGSGGLGGVVARAGWNSGNGTDFFELPQSGDQSGILALETTSNPGTAQDGNWVFNVVGGEVTQTGDCTTTVAVDEDDLSQPASTFQGNNDVAPGDDLLQGSQVSVSGALHVLYGADGPGELLGVQYTGPALTSQGKPVVFVQEEGVWFGRVLDNDPGTEGDQPRNVFKLEVDFTAQTFTFTLLDNLDHPLTDNPSTVPIETSFEDNLLLTFGITVTDYDGDAITSTITVNVDDDTPTVEANQGDVEEPVFASVVLDESVGNDLSSPGDPNATSDDTGVASPFGSATISAGMIAGLFTAQAGADGEGSHAYGFVLKDAEGGTAPFGTTFVQTNLHATDIGNIYTDDTIYLEQVSTNQINGYVGAAENPANLALRFVIDTLTGEVTVEQYLAIHHDFAGSSPAAYDDLQNLFIPGEGESGGIFVSYILTDGDNDTASAISDQPLSVTIEDDGLNVNIVDAPNSVIETQAINGTWTLMQGADGIASVEVTVGLTSQLLPMNGLHSVSFGPGDGAFGTLTVFSDGTWTYTAGSVSGDQSFAFTVKATDGDGDTSSDSQTITIHDTTNTLVQSAPFTGTVEEEQLGHVVSPAYASSFIGNEDQDTHGAPTDNDLDTANSGVNSFITSNVASNAFIVVGGTGPYTFHLAPSGIEGTQAQFADSPVGMTSHGAPVLLHVSGNTLTGYTNVGPIGYVEGQDHVVFTFQINSGSGAGIFTLYDNVDHHVAGDGVEGTRSLNLDAIVQVTDSSLPSPQTLSLNGSVGIIDDVPVANTDTATVNEGGNGTTNFLLTIDTSASMTDNPGVPGFATRLDLEKAALINLLNSANVNQVFIVSFNTGAVDSGGWLSKAAAIAFISGLTATGLTNYDAALADTETAFTFAHTGADHTLSYFLSDGVPNLPFLSPGINATEQATWETFLTTNGVAESFAVGVGTGATLSALQPIAFPNGDPNNPVVLTDQSQLTSTLIHTLPGTANGNVLANDTFGADGPGINGIVSILVDGHLYAYNAGAITKDGGAFVSGSTLDLDTTLGGHLTFHFTTGGGFAAGDWHYLSPADVITTTAETFHYVIADGDGDQIGADLNVTVTAVNDPPVANDDTIITNIDGSGAAIAIPDLALLLNDVDPDGPTLTVSSVGVPLSGAVAHAATTTTFTDNDLSGGSFDYTMQDGGVPNLSDTAHATVNRSQAGESQLDGTASGEILIGRSGTADTLVGGGGSDVLFGNTGDDHFRYNANNEGLDHILDFGSGSDVLDFDHNAFGNGLAGGGADTGTLDSSHFVANGTGATNVNEKFWYNTTDHTLYFDADGSGAGAPIAMAKLENAHALASGEIHMV